MEAIIRTENKTLFEAILEFLKKLNFTVETKETPLNPAHVKTEKQKEHFDSLRLKTKNIKFNREEANEK